MRKIFYGCAVLMGLSYVAGEMDLRIDPVFSAAIISSTPVLVMWVLYLIKDNDLYQ
jgi:hypothetical protein